MGSTLRWDLGEKDGKVGMGLGAGFVATGVEHQQDDGEQADRRACDAGEMVIHRRRGQCRSADDGTDRIAEIEGDLYGGTGNQLAAALARLHHQQLLWR